MGHIMTNPNLVDISGALFTMNPSILILNSQCEEGARDVNYIWVTVVTFGKNILFTCGKYQFHHPDVISRVVKLGPNGSGVKE